MRRRARARCPSKFTSVGRPGHGDTTPWPGYPAGVDGESMPDPDQAEHPLVPTVVNV